MRARLTVETPLGRVVLVAGERAVEELLLPETSPAETIPERRTHLLCRAEKELQEYFRGERRDFDLPLAPAGTPFQQRVWQELCRIPYGRTVSYGEIARRIGLPKGPRAIGQANHRNPIPILIPCHRVIAAQGAPGGYGGGLDIKIRLLKLEGTRMIEDSAAHKVKILS
ncbi:MAG: methylated-DNA--[Lentisphaeria bacterium]|nr:methylated-DNA--[protein]-cysteine S-methyltransferase [Lentisphaeria bacterium]